MRATVTRLFLLTFCCSVVQAKLSIEQIREEVNKKGINHYSVVNPLFGWLLEATGCLSNLRFFSSSLVPALEDNKRIYVKDTSDDPFIQSLIMLFPSPAGTLCRMHAFSTGFAKNFDKFKEQGTRFLAELFVSVVGKRQTVELPPETKNTRDLVNCCKALGNLLQDKKCPYSSAEEGLKPLLIHAFVIDSFDDPKDLGAYLDAISRGVESLELQDLSRHLKDCKFDIFDTVTATYCSTNFFPYSLLNLPPSNDLIPVYNRKGDKFDEKKTFSDCVDVMLLNLCNCLFCDNEHQQYSVEHLPESAPVRTFYEQHTKLFTITREIRKEWSMVVQDLPDFEAVDDGEHKTHLIIYNKPERNELYPGIINMMNVLAKICGIDAGLPKDLNKGKLAERLKAFLWRLKVPGCEIEIEAPVFTEYWPKGRKDYVGDVQIKFMYKTGDEAVVSIMQNDVHSKLKFVSSRCAKNDMLRLSQDFLKVVSEAELPIPIVLLKRYMLLVGGKKMPPCEDYDDQSSLFNMIFISGPLSSNSEKCTMLDKLYGGALRTKMEAGLDLLERTCKLLIGSVNLNDPGTRQEFSPFFIHDSDLVDQDKTIGHWKNALISGYKDTAEFWEAILPKKDVTVVDFSGMRIGKDGGEVVAKSLKGMVNLKILNLSGNYICDEGAEAIAKRLAEVPNLAVLDLGKNNIGNEGVQHIAEHLKDAPSLTTLNLEDNNIGSEGTKCIAEHLGNAKNLTTFNFSGNDIRKEGAKAITSSLSKMPELTILNLSRSHTGSSGAYEICCELRYMRKLAILDLSENGIDSWRVTESMIDELAHSRSLKTIDLSRNGIKDAGVEIIRRKLARVPNLIID